MIQERILITGAGGQLGAVLFKALQERYGKQAVLATDLYEQSRLKGRFEVLDATNLEALEACVKKNSVTQIYHLAAILSAKGEQNPLKTWDVNMATFFNVLEVARQQGVGKVFYPSSIAVFGADIEPDAVPQFPNLTPTTSYGMSKVAGENWANYYFKKYGLDVRSLRYPGVIGYQSLPGGGTTDYAVEIYHKAVKDEMFECFLKPSTKLPMIFMDDAIRATIELMEAPLENISVRTSYNLASMSFAPSELFEAIKIFCPNFEITYKPDFRQAIADSWPNSIDDSAARKDWGWKPEYDLQQMSEVMITQLKTYYNSISQKI